MKNTKITFSMKRNLMLGLLSVFGLSIAQMATASTVVYYRMEDGAALLTDYSGNGNTATTSVASIVDIPATGDGSAFSDPIPQTGDSNSKMGYFNGTKHAQVADPFGDSGLTDFTAEAYINLSGYKTSTQYVMGQFIAGGTDRSWTLGVAASGGTGTADPNEMFALLSGDGSNSIIVPLGLTVSLDTDYYFAFAFDGSETTNDITFYYQDLTNGGSLVTNTISSTITTLKNSGTEFNVGAYGNGTSRWTGFIDEVRVSDTILSSSELLAVVPEPSSIALVLVFASVFMIGTRRRR